MTAVAVLTVEVHVLHELAESGVWCDDCLLPSAVAVPFQVVIPSTLSRVGRGTVVWCEDCGRYRARRNRP